MRSREGNEDEGGTGTRVQRDKCAGTVEGVAQQRKGYITEGDHIRHSKENDENMDTQTRDEKGRIQERIVEKERGFESEEA